MKYLFGISFFLIIAVPVFATQQDPQPKQTPSIQPTAEALMKAQAAADKAQAKHEQSSTEELKKLVEREIAKSAALPVTTTVQEPINPRISPKLLQNVKLEVKVGMVVVEGAVYIRVGDSIWPMIGSECYLTPEEADAKNQRAKAKFAEMIKAEPVKKD